MELKHNLSFDIGTIVPTLLIVPYGIETYHAAWNHQDGNLLIVPYGIETTPAIPLTHGIRTFNRTLWN